jgi:hypothetical protein
VSTHAATATTIITLTRMIALHITAAVRIMLTMLGMSVFDKTFINVPIAAKIHGAGQAGQGKCDLPEQKG